MTSTPSALSLTNVTYHYRHQWTGKRIQALHEVTLNIARGELFGFLGHNGAGKTTTIKCILSLITPSGGTITIDGMDHRDPRAREKVGYVPEQPYFYDHLTVQETMDLYATLSGVPSDARSKAVAWALDRVRISSRTKSPLRSLSKGLTQRLALAQAIVAQPTLLILDEPFSGLDPIGRKEFREIFVELNQSGTTIFMSSHALGDIEAMCDRVSIMAQGALKGVFDLKNRAEQAKTVHTLTLRVEGELPFKIPLPAHQERLKDRITLRYKEKSHATQVLGSALAQHLEILNYAQEQERLEDLFVDLVRFREEGGAE